MNTKEARYFSIADSVSRLSKAELYISRKHKDGTLAMARPCASCMALIRSCGISKIHYTTVDGYAAETIID